MSVSKAVKKSIKFEYSDGKKSRKYQANLHGSSKDTFVIRNSSPGPKLIKTSKIFSEYKKQLMTKQKLKAHYAIGEKTFANCIKNSINKIGNTADLIISTLESRLLSVVFKAGFTNSIFTARQMIAHKHIKVNGKVCNIKSRLLKEGDVITLVEESPFKLKVQDSLKAHKAPSYLVIDSEKAFVKFSKKPSLLEVKFPFELQINHIIEYYSR